MGACICDFVLRFTRCNRVLHAYQHQVTKKKDWKDTEVELDEVLLTDEKDEKADENNSKNEYIYFTVMVIFAVAVILLLRGVGITVLNAIIFLGKSYYAVRMLQPDP